MDLKGTEAGRPKLAFSSATATAGVGAALLAILAGLGAKYGLDRLFGTQATFVFFVPAVVVASALSGIWPGLAATFMGFSAGLVIDGADGNLARADLSNGIVFLLVGAIVATGGETFRRARRRADEITLDLTVREQHLQSILETIPDAMIVIDEAGLIRDFS
jgi:two-component system sensor kinase FixL